MGRGPTFLGIGGQKAGTTWLHSVLAQAPDVYVPPVKELHHFDRLDGRTVSVGLAPAEVPRKRGITLYKKPKGRFSRNAQRVLNHAVAGEFSALMFYYRFMIKKRQAGWYDSLFPPRYAIRGEITPEYALLSEDMIRSIVGDYPDLKAIYLLRNPVDRSWSGYRYNVTRSGQDRSDQAAMDGFLTRSAAIERAAYADHIDRWARHLKPGHLLVGFYDALQHHPQALLSDISRFLECSPLQPVSERVNVSVRIEMPDSFKAKAEAIYRDEIATLARRYGGYCSDWSDGILSSTAAHDASVVI